MKKIIILCLLLVSLSACTSKNEYGKCVGLMDQKNPKIEYEFSIWNAVVAMIFSETVVVPVVWGAGYLQCPVGEKK